MSRIVLIFFLVCAVWYVHAAGKSCGRNETSDICGRICEPSCSNRKPKICPRIQCSESIRKCRCNNGFYRNEAGKCVRPEKCPKKRDKRSLEENLLSCGDNERYGDCGRLCEGTCGNRNVTSCSTMKCSGKGCQCKEGYLRNEKTDSCVPDFSCPKIRTVRQTRKGNKCMAGESLGACGRRCEGTCQNPYTPEICARIRCADLACRCDLAKGYVRNTKTNKCVRTEKCPK